MIYSDKWVWGAVLQELYSFQLLWHWCLIWCSKSCKDRQSNFSTLHAVQLSWNPNSIYSYFMTQFKSDKWYSLQTLSWTKYTQHRHSVKKQGSVLWNPYGISILLLAPNIFQRMKFFVLLYMVFDRVAVCSVIRLWVIHKFPLWECDFFQIRSTKASKLHWVCYDWYLSILISVWWNCPVF